MLRAFLATLSVALVLPATALAAEEHAAAEEQVTAFMMILIIGLIAFGLLIAVLESRKSK